MCFVLIEDDGYFIVEKSARGLAESLECANEVRKVFDRYGRQYDAQQIKPGVV